MDFPVNSRSDIKPEAHTTSSSALVATASAAANLLGAEVVV